MLNACREPRVARPPPLSVRCSMEHPLDPCSSCESAAAPALQVGAAVWRVSLSGRADLKPTVASSPFKQLNQVGPPCRRWRMSIAQRAFPQQHAVSRWPHTGIVMWSPVSHSEAAGPNIRLLCTCHSKQGPGAPAAARPAAHNDSTDDSLRDASATRPGGTNCWGP